VIEGLKLHDIIDWALSITDHSDYTKSLRL